MPLLRRAVKLVAATFGFLVYVWYAARARDAGREAAEGRAEKGARSLMAPS